MLVDSHCHLNLLDLQAHYDGDIGKVIAEAAELDVQHMLCVSVGLDTFPLMRDLVAPFDNVSVSVGVHPDGDASVVVSRDELLRLADDPKVVAIGETGLDYFHCKGDTEWQRDRFRTHIQVARECGKPLIIHTREARDDTLRVLEEQNAVDVGGVMHCFTEDWEMAERAMEMGFYISFSGIVTFKNALQLKEVARRVPTDRFLVETDCPYLAPMPYRGKPNKPAWTRYVAEYIAELRGSSYTEIATQTTENYFRLFGAVA